MGVRERPGPRRDRLRARRLRARRARQLQRRGIRCRPAPPRPVRSRRHAPKPCPADPRPGSGPGPGGPGRAGRPAGGPRAAAAAPARAARLSGRTLGAVSLGRRRAANRRAFTFLRNSRSPVDRFCLSDGRHVRVGYPSRALLRSLARATAGACGPGDLRHDLQPRLLGARHRARLDAARLRGSRRFRVGLNDWYLAPGGSATLLFKVRRGKVLEVGRGRPPPDRRRARPALPAELRVRRLAVVRRVCRGRPRARVGARRVPVSERALRPGRLHAVQGRRPDAQRPRRQARVDVRGHARRRAREHAQQLQPVRARRRPRRPPGRRRRLGRDGLGDHDRAGPTWRSPCSTPASSGTTAAR